MLINVTAKMFKIRTYENENVNVLMYEFKKKIIIKRICLLKLSITISFEFIFYETIRQKLVVVTIP